MPSFCPWALFSTVKVQSCCRKQPYNLENPHDWHNYRSTTFSNPFLVVTNPAFISMLGCLSAVTTQFAKIYPIAIKGTHSCKTLEDLQIRKLSNWRHSSIKTIHKSWQPKLSKLFFHVNNVCLLFHMFCQFFSSTWSSFQYIIFTSDHFAWIILMWISNLTV